MALGTAAGSGAENDEVALRVLAKLDQLLPRRLRRRLNALPAVTVTLADPRAAISLRVLSTLAAACRDRFEVRFRYQDGQGTATSRRVEPMRLVHTGYRWYWRRGTSGGATGEPSESIASTAPRRWS